MSTATRRSAPPASLPRLGFLGVGWIGRHRLASVAESGAAVVAGIADPAPAALRGAGRAAPGAALCESLSELLRTDLDGLVIATPSALHAEHVEAAFGAGLAVFCQKPLGRTESETRRLIDAARDADRLLGVDMCYRHTAAMRRIRSLVADGELGDVYAAELVFHNAYGPDKDWFSDIRLAGGGCMMDLGIHLVDLALWVLGYPAVREVSGSLFAGGRRLDRPPDVVEDYAEARLVLDGGQVVRIAASWCLAAGRDAVIRAELHGTRGGAAMLNVNGSFHDFVAERYTGTKSQTVVEPPDEWGGRAVVEWARRLGAGWRYDPEIEQLADVARVLDAVYGRCES